MFRVFIKELNGFLDSLIAYIIIGIFLISIGLLTWVFPETSVLEYGFADMSTLFNLGPYVFMFLIPAITMRSFSEERKSGTLELLLTKPLHDWQIIGGKFLAGLAIVVFSLLPTLLYYYSIYQLGSPQGNIDTAGTMGSFIGLFLLGAAFTSIGIFASSLTENQVISFVIAVFISFLLYSGMTSFANIDVWGSFSTLIEQMGILYHYEAMSRGLIDSRNVIYFFSVITIMFMATNLVLGSRRW